MKGETNGMDYTFEQLKHKTVAELREIAKGIEHEAVQGYTQLHKDPLLLAICKALKIDAHEHHAAALAEKSTLKAKMRAVKAARAKAVAGGDYDLARTLRRQYHGMNHTLRTSAKQAVGH